MSVFRFKKFDVHQHPEVFKVGTDGCLLGALADIDNGSSVLDVGTGTGLVALMCAQRNNTCDITAIDINPISIELAQTNFSKSKYRNRLTALHTDINELDSDPKYSSIVCNPPFFKSGIRKESVPISMARHEKEDGLKSMISAFSNLLLPTGRVSLILPIQRKNECLGYAELQGLSLLKSIMIHPFPSKKANRVILVLSKEIAKENEQTHFILYDKINQLSDEAIQLLKPFYINL